jgi:DNA-binding MarR family transcriptional regulator
MFDRPSNHSSSVMNAKAKHRYFDRIADHAEAVGLPRDVAQALTGIDASAFVWRRRTIKSEMTKRILSALDTDLEPAEFEALTAVARLSSGIGAPARDDVTIGDIAEEMSVDPSRASRLVAALVNKGLLRREIAQDDARKSVLKPTPESGKLFEDFMVHKWEIVFAAFKGWSRRDIESFERLLSRYVVAMDEALAAAGTPESAPPVSQERPARPARAPRRAKISKN